MSNITPPSGELMFLEKYLPHLLGGGLGSLSIFILILWRSGLLSAIIGILKNVNINSQHDDSKTRPLTASEIEQHFERGRKDSEGIIRELTEYRQEITKLSQSLAEEKRIVEDLKRSRDSQSGSIAELEAEIRKQTQSIHKLEIVVTELKTILDMLLKQEPKINGI